ncbi:hypothetical protein LWI28_010971 [Acer negundo]|uniref:Uncharacterized protein n=1 Tax=Acer negundo TaxID=4023 RepID=A0AAD5JIQ8_ACENE|nr:hypothetical protein LWI28_010971 [Acer negundo]
MESESSTASPSLSESAIEGRDFLNHLEAHLTKREGVDKLLKISNYATKIILASSVLPETATLTRRLKSFESSVEVSRKALRLRKFIQCINALRNFYSGLIDHKHLRNLEKVSVWAEFIGYFGSISLTIRDLKRINKDEEALKSSIKVAISRGNGYCEAEERMRKLREEKLMNGLSIVQDLAEGLAALADILDGKGRLSSIKVAISRGNGYCEEEERMRKLREEKLMNGLSIVQDLAEGLAALADILDGKGRLSSIKVAISRGNGYCEEEERMRKLREEKLMNGLSIVQDLAEGLAALADILDGKGRLSSIKVAISRGNGYCEEEERMRKLREEKLMNGLSIVQDLAEGLAALADILDGKGRLSGPVLLAFAVLLSAVISSHNTWISC